MGLDMFLTKKTYIGAQYEWRKITGEINIKKRNKEVKIDFKKVTYIIEEICYWRKENSIHNWFVENVQNSVDDCGEYYVSEKDLKSLIDDIDMVLKNKNKASGTLPTKSGFFFGNTNYDNNYFYSLKEVKRDLIKAIKEKGEGEFYYSSSW